MARRIGTWICCLVTAASTLVGCSGQHGSTGVEGPPAPSMPAGWEIISDISFPAVEVKHVGRNLGGELASLRNTVYEVNGKRVQLNTIEAVDAASAGRVMLRLRDMKPDEFLLRKGVICYEFVFANEAIPEARAGKAHLEGAS